MFVVLCNCVIVCSNPVYNTWYWEIVLLHALILSITKVDFVHIFLSLVHIFMYFAHVFSLQQQEQHLPKENPQKQDLGGHDGGISDLDEIRPIQPKGIN